MTTALKSWEELGTTGFAGPATYRKQFTAAAAPKGKRVYLEIADVHDYAQGDAERQRAGRARLAALSLGRDRRAEEGRERSGDRGGRAGRRPRRRVWRSASGCCGSGVARARLGDGSARRCWHCRGRSPQTKRRGGSCAVRRLLQPAEARAVPPAAPATSGLLGSVKLVAY